MTVIRFWSFLFETYSNLGRTEDWPTVVKGHGEFGNTDAQCLGF